MIIDATIAAEHGGSRARDLEWCYADAGTSVLLRGVLTDVFSGEIAVVSSFGVESAVLLHLVSRIEPRTPVIFIDTGRHFPETLAYRNELVGRLGLSDVRSAGPSVADVARLDPNLSRAQYDPDGCCHFRKVEPLREALMPFRAWISGRKRFHGDTRSALPLFEADSGRVKVNPLATWSAEDCTAYAARFDLPTHKLVAHGYASIGCAPCTRRVAPGEAVRAGRWPGFDKTECGIHAAPGDSAAESNS